MKNIQRATERGSEDNNHHFIEDPDDFSPYYEGLLQEPTNNIIKANWSAIQTKKCRHKYSLIYNIRILDNNPQSALASDNFEAIFDEQSWKFKANAALGFILLNNETGELRYWHASSGIDKLLQQSMLIENYDDFQRFYELLSDSDFIENTISNRDNTSWSMHCITNINIYIQPIINHLIS